MKRYHDYLAGPKRSDEEVADFGFVERVVCARFVGSNIALDGNHRAPKSRTASRSSAQRAGFKKRRKKGNQ